MKDKIPMPLIKMAIATKGTVRISKQGVPHITVRRNNITYSICYFYRSNTWRVFFPYPAKEQEKISFNNFDDTVQYINKDVLGLRR